MSTPAIALVTSDCEARLRVSKRIVKDTSAERSTSRQQAKRPARGRGQCSAPLTARVRGGGWGTAGDNAAQAAAGHSQTHQMTPSPSIWAHAVESHRGDCFSALCLCHRRQRVTPDLIVRNGARAVCAAHLAKATGTTMLAGAACAHAPFTRGNGDGRRGPKRHGAQQHARSKTRAMHRERPCRVGMAHRPRLAPRAGAPTFGDDADSAVKGTRPAPAMARERSRREGLLGQFARTVGPASW